MKNRFYALPLRRLAKGALRLMGVAIVAALSFQGWDASAQNAPAHDQQPVDSLALPTGKTDWIDPIRATPPRTRYILYPTPSRGHGTAGSCMVYIPEEYEQNPAKRYPVVYYLHGGTGNQREARWMIARIDSAITAGKMEPLIVVSPQALPIGWYINANTNDPKVTSGPIHDVIINDLLPYIDSHFRTVAAPSGRGIEGFSMGGRGTLMLAFMHPELFGAASSVAGALVDWDEEPLQRSLECTFGSVDSPLSRTYFDAWHPRTFACVNARKIIADGMKIRMFVGTADRLFEENGHHMTTRFHNLLDSLSIPHTFETTPGANHNPLEIFDPGKRTYDTSFWDNALRSEVATTSAPLSLPDTLSSFLSEHFPGVSPEVVTALPDERGTHHQILLSDGTLLKFNEHGKWILADRTASGKPLPSSLIHEGIISDTAANHPATSVIRIEKVPRTGYDTLLSDGSTPLYDTAGNPIARDN